MRWASEKGVKLAVWYFDCGFTTSSSDFIQASELEQVANAMEEIEYWLEDKVDGEEKSWTQSRLEYEQKLIEAKTLGEPITGIKMRNIRIAFIVYLFIFHLNFLCTFVRVIQIEKKSHQNGLKLWNNSRWSRKSILCLWWTGWSDGMESVSNYTVPRYISCV